jgi:predicted alpha-1,2-mannosidase
MKHPYDLLKLIYDMKYTGKQLILGLVFIFSAGFADFSSVKNPVDYVDPKIGTAIRTKRWMLFPGATTPFGMVALSPDNLDRTGWYKGGFDPHLGNIAGFSHIHAWTMAGLLTMPAVGELKVQPGTMEDPDSGYRSRFSKDVASAGYYAVTLDDYNIRAEFTATTRSGFHRYTFPETEQAHILFDLKFPSEYHFNLVSADIKKNSDTEIIGYSRMVENKHTGPWQDYILHFVIQFDKPFRSFGFWRNDEVFTDVDQLDAILDADIGTFVNFTTQEGEVIKVKTGFSLVSIDQARLNLETETGSFGWDFDAVRNASRTTWNDLLKKIEIEGGTEADKTKFYTALYRSFCARATLSDVNGKYVDMCEQVVQLEDPDSPLICGDGFWGSYWNLNQLWSLITPNINNIWVKSLLEFYDRGGWLPKGPAGMEYTGVMLAEPEIPLIVGAFQKGIRNYDVEKAYQAIRKAQMEQGIQHGCGGFAGSENINVYKELGYVPYEEGATSATLENAYYDWCVAQMAKALGKTEDYDYFMKRSQNYRNVFDPSVGYMRPKSRMGEWKKDFDPFSRGKRQSDIYQTWNMGYTDFVEGNAWQYTFFAPHDVPGIIELLGKDTFNTRLKYGFEQAKFSKFSYPNLPSYDSKYVHHGNQPNMQAAWLFNWSGMPWETQHWAREIMNVYYGASPEDGYQGDEDEGQMSAWFVMSALGLFQMDGGASVNPIYEIGSPLFEKAVIHLDNNYYPGSTFTIEARNNSDKNRHIQSAVLNGKPLNKPWFYHSELVEGGSLVLQMGPKPNKNWGVSR